MRITANVTGLRWPALENLQKELDENLDRAVRKVALQTERAAELNAPVDTGALRASIYAVTSKSNGSAKARADAVRPRVSTKSGQVVVAKLAGSEPKLAGKYRAMIVVGVEYGGPVNYGTKKMQANGYLTKALWKARPMLRQAVREAFARAAAGEGVTE